MATLLVLALIALAAVPHLIDWNSHRETLGRALGEKAGAPVRIEGDLRIALFPTLEIDADLVALGPSERPLARIGRLNASLSVLALARGIVQFTALRADRVVLRAELAGIEPGSRSAPAGRIGIDRLDLRGMTLLAAGSDRAILRELDVIVEAPDLAGPIRFEARDRAAGREMRGQLGKFEQGRARLRATLEDQGLAVRASLEGWLGGPGDPTQPLFDGSIAYNGNPVLGDAAEGVQMPFDGQARLLVAAGQAIVDPASLTLGAAERAVPISGRAFLDFAADRPALRLELAGRRLDLSRYLTDDPEGVKALERLRRSVAALAGRTTEAGPALPVDLEAEWIFAAVQGRGFLAQDVRLAFSSKTGGLAIGAFEARLPGGAQLRFEAADRAALLDGALSIEAADLPAFVQALGGATGPGLPPSASLRTRLRSEGLRLVMPQWRLESPSGVLAGEMRIDLPGAEGRATPRLAFDLAAERLDARLLALADPLRAGSGAADLALDGRLVIRELLFDGNAIGGVRLAFSRDGARSRLDELTLSGRAGEELRLSGQFADGLVRATAKLDAERLGDLSRIAEAVFPGAWTQAIHARAERLSPALAVANIRIETRGGESIWDIQSEGRFGGTNLLVRSQSELKGNDLNLSLRAEASNAVGSRLLAQIGGADAGPALGGEGRLNLQFEGNPRRQLSTRLQAALAGLKLEAEGTADVFRTAPFEGAFRLESADIAPLYRALGGGAPGLPDGTPARIAGRYFAETRKLTLTAFDAAFGPNRVEGEISFDFARNGQVAGQLRMGDLELETLLSPALPPSDLASGMAHPRPLRPGVRPFLAGDLWIEAQALRLGGARVLDEPKFVLRFAPDLAAIEGLEAGSGEARLSSTVTLQRREDQLHAAGQFGFSRLALPGLGGRLSGEVPFTSQGRSLGELLSGFAGAGRIRAEGVIVPAAEPGALSRLLARPAAELQPLDENRIGALLEQEMRGGMLALPALSMPITILGGVVRISAPAFETGSAPGRARVQPSVIIDLPRAQFEARLGLRLADPPPQWRGALPEAALLWNGRLALPPFEARRSLSVSALLNGLLAANLQRDLEVIEAYDADQRERAFFLRRSRADFLRGTEAPTLPIPQIR